MVAIYKITSPSNKVYIGKSLNVVARFWTYRKVISTSIGRRLLHSLKKYGSENHLMEVIHELPKDLPLSILSEYEKIYISAYKDCGIKLLNLTDGGDGSSGYKHTKEALNLMSIKGKGRFSGDKNPNYGKGCFGKTNGSFGKSRRHICLIAAQANEKPVYQFSLDEIFIKKFKSATEAAKLCNLKTSNISSCCLLKKGYNTAGGFLWKHEMYNGTKPIYYAAETRPNKEN